MYYEEKIINGVLMYRNTPKGDWQQCSIEKMSTRLVALQNEVIDLKASLRERMPAATLPW